MHADEKTIVRTLLGPAHLQPLPAAQAPAAVDAVFAGLSARSRYLRFHSPVPRLSHSLRRSLTDLDGQRRVAVVARILGDPVGIARFVATGPGGDAEVAVAVVDRCQGRGIGHALLAALAEIAADLGYRQLTGSVLPENVAMLGLAARFALGSRPVWDGETVRLRIPLGPLTGAADWTITDEDVLADLLAR